MSYWIEESEEGDHVVPLSRERLSHQFTVSSYKTLLLNYNEFKTKITLFDCIKKIIPLYRDIIIVESRWKWEHITSFDCIKT